VKPYYEDSSVTIFHGDCRDVLGDEECRKRYSSDDILVFTDPPYGVDYDGGTLVREKLEGDKTFECYDWLVPRLSRFEGPAYVCCPDRALPTIVRLAGDSLRAVIVWRKRAQYGALSAHYKQANEFIAYIIPEGARSLWTGPTTETTDWSHERPSKSLHPTEKPIALASRAIGNHSASLVLDPYAGSGSTLVAARDLHRRAIGIELQERYCEIAAERCRQGTFTFCDRP
jgi:site-specific DNA-methyltransferase (adenine-specific)